jgi:hypothetical protein
MWYRIFVKDGSGSLVRSGFCAVNVVLYGSAQPNYIWSGKACTVSYQSSLHGKDLFGTQSSEHPD